MTPIGALIRKIDRHEATWVRRPPSTGPRLRPSETLTPLRPSARPRSDASKVRAMTAGPIAVIAAAPQAWRTRNATSQAWLGARPHSTLATVKMPKPAR